MQTTLIITAVITWCVIGYFVILKVTTTKGNVKVFDVACCLLFCFGFPLFIIGYAIGMLIGYFYNLNLFQKLADWHNRGRK